MKKLIVCSAAVALAAGVFLSTRDVRGQAGAEPAPHQVGLIDMAYVFKNYEKFKTQTTALQAEIKEADDEAKARFEQMKVVQERLKGGSVEAASADAQKLEAQLIQMQSDLEAFRKNSQLKFLRREADIYKTVYLEVQQAVELYAQHHKYTLIMRFNRAAVDEAEDPQSIIQSMNRQVVYYKPGDDCTDPVLRYLNGQFAKSSGGAATARPRTASGQAPAPQ